MLEPRTDSRLPPATDSPFQRQELVWLSWLLGWFAAVWLLSALAAPLVYDWVAPLFDQPPRFARVARRVAMILAILGLVLWVKRWGAVNARAFGLARDGDWRRRFARRFGVGFGIGGGVLLLEAVSGYWRWAPSLSVKDVLEATLGALIIGVLEEGIFRGFLLFARPPRGATATAVRVALISVIYSAIHFTRGGAKGGPTGDYPGFALWAQLPKTIYENLDAFAGLVAIGVMLSALALRQREAWRAAGLHAGLVAGLRLATQLLEPAQPGPTLLLTSGVQPGWGSILPLLIASVFLLQRRRSSGWGREARAASSQIVSSK